MKKIWGAIFLGVLSISTAYAQISADEYEVYSAVLKHSTGTDGAVVNTKTSERDLFNASIVASIESKSGMKLEQGLKDRYIALNQTPQPLENKFSSDLKISMITDEEMNNIFKDGEGWNVFRQKYGRVCTVSMSRIAFNEAKDLALVYIGTQCDWLAGHGDHLLMKKENGAWTIVTRVMDWIS